MSVRVSVRQLQEHLPELLEQTALTGQECIIQQDGQDYVILVSAHQWQRRGTEDGLASPAVAATGDEEARAREVGKRLDALGPEYRLPFEEQERMEELLARRETAPLTPEDQHELDALIARCDEIMLRRAKALRRVG